PGGQPASLHRPRGADARRESRGHQSTRDRRRVRLPGPTPRPRQGAGVHREPGQGRLQALPRSGRLRRRHDHQVQPELRSRPRDREVDEHDGLPARAGPRDRPRPAQRDVLARNGHLFTCPTHVFPFDTIAVVASSGPLYAKWFQSAGTQGKEPPARMKELMAKFKRAYGVPEKERIQLGKDVWKITAEEVYIIGV